eukprot:TRINITY_DN10759_c0_g2_i1.p1 TRINITY_DN10759_c0_g2~~TRINITY_DN10759_c0_g2_i1.p1  ORF type:complete len:227 (+),score=66.88 TRINITY_DN10759_c0_g2_i1:48-728(+)
MEDYEVSQKGSHLSVVGQHLSSIPEDLAVDYPNTTELDLSNNEIQNVSNLDGFTKLKNLVLDSNNLDSNQEFPKIDTLETLWVNDNNIEELTDFIEKVVESFPNLTYLSMFKNPACPNFFTGKEEDDYKRYRYYVLHKLPKLKFLDASPVSKFELSESKRVGHLMVVAKPAPEEYSKRANNNNDDIVGLPPTLKQPGQAKASFGQTKYVYYGKQSEGNRFILNSDL